jgi:long-chain acyl-CoA synthetase
MSHISGANLISLAILNGSTLVILDTIRPDFILGTIEKHRVNWFHGVPPIFQSLLKASDQSCHDTSSLRLIAMMGAPVPLSLLKEFQEKFPGVAVCQGYGMTETSPLITLLGPRKAITKMGSVGETVPKIEARIVDDLDRPLPPNRVGEVTVSGPQVMKGYHKDEEATAQMIRNGRLYTGDLGYFDGEGFLYLVGRKKEMIITGGLNVFPSEIEEILLKHPQVNEAAAVGVPDFMRGEIIKAVVALQPGRLISKQELVAYCRQQLADYKVPSEIEFRQSLPRTSTGKIAKRELMDGGTS